MAIRNGNALWTGDLKDGKGELEIGHGVFKGPYSFTSRFEDGPGTNPEELIASAHAACYSMALSATLAKSNYKPISVATRADLHFEKTDAGFTVTRIVLNADAKVESIKDEDFQRIAHEAKVGCPVSRALAAVTIELKAQLL
jgi:osmotically inducible protein OsmC